MSEFHLRSRYIRAAKHSQSIEAVYVHSMHFLAISAEGIRTALLLGLGIYGATLTRFPCELEGHALVTEK